MNGDPLKNAVRIAAHPELAAVPAAGFAPITADELRAIVEDLVAACDAAGFVLTVEQRPLQPLRMGHYETVVSVRPARAAA